MLASSLWMQTKTLSIYILQLSHRYCFHGQSNMMYYPFLGQWSRKNMALNFSVSGDLCLLGSWGTIETLIEGTLAVTVHHRRTVTFATNNMDFSLSDFFMRLVSILVMATLTYMNFKLFSRTYRYSYHKITKKFGNLNGCMMFMTVPF